MTVLFKGENVSTLIPRYVQIIEQLVTQIEDGTLKPGEQLPPERELSKQLNVNRLTLRQALDNLEMRGLIERRQGKGTFIAPPKIERSADQFFPFSAGMKKMGYNPSAQVLNFEERAADTVAAKRLNLPLEALVYYGHRLRYYNGEPAMLEQFLLPANRFPGLKNIDLSSRSIYEVMQNEYGVKLATASQSLEPVIATAYEAELLCVPIGAPLMLERRLTYDEQGQPVEYTKDSYRGDRFRFITQTLPVDQELLQILQFKK